MVSFTFRPFTPGERANGSLWKGGWVGLGTGKEMRKYLVHAASRIPMLKSSSQWPTHYTDWAFPDPSRHRLRVHLLASATPWCMSHFFTVVNRVATSNHVCCDFIGWHGYWLVTLDQGLWPNGYGEFFDCVVMQKWWLGLYLMDLLFL